jgi:hypothetical protein
VGLFFDALGLVGIGALTLLVAVLAATLDNAVLVARLSVTKDGQITRFPFAATPR